MTALSMTIIRPGQTPQSCRLEPFPVVNGGLTESCTIKIVPPQGQSWEFLIDDEPLLTDPEGHWTWAPGFYAGRVLASLVGDGSVVSRYIIDIGTHPDKLSTEAHERMLKELKAFRPELVIGSEPATGMLGTMGDSDDPWVAFRRLRLHAPSFITALKRVARNPIRRTRASRRVGPLRTARRIDPRTLLSAAANGRIGVLSGCNASLESGHDQPDPHFDLVHVEEHLDSPANRALKAMLEGVLRRARILMDVLEHHVSLHSASGAETSLKRRWPVRKQFLTRLESKLLRLTRQQPFLSASEGSITTAGLIAIAAHPEYSRAHKTGWLCVRNGIEDLHDLESVWLCPTWALYERWCFWKVISHLERRLEVKGLITWQQDAAEWEAEIKVEKTISILFQGNFSSFSAPSRQGRYSISGHRVPDIVVTLNGSSDQRFLVLDAKYRHSRSNVLDAMSSAHIYNDSLRWNDNRPWRSLLLIPAGGEAAWLEDSEFHDLHGVGVVQSSPGCSSRVLEDLLDKFLSS